jgi:hypothetical protein
VAALDRLSCAGRELYHAPMTEEPPDDPRVAASDVGPTEDEIEAWAERERARRRAWLDGPSPDERAAWARRERARRRLGLEPGARATELARRGQRYGRETMLATEGAFSLLTHRSRRLIAELVRAGLEWEDEVVRPPRRRIRLDDEER